MQPTPRHANDPASLALHPPFIWYKNSNRFGLVNTQVTPLYHKADTMTPPSGNVVHEAWKKTTLVGFHGLTVIGL